MTVYVIETRERDAKRDRKTGGDDELGADVERLVVENARLREGLFKVAAAITELVYPEGTRHADGRN